MVSDLVSKNASFVNADKLEREREIGNGDRIQVGETVFSFIDEERTDKSATSGLNGKEIGGYRILERIGRGGMGTVFKARQISLNRIVALKLLSSKLAVNPTFVEKFVSEARAAGQLNHPNVVQVFDVGQSGGLYYFSMEFMEGGCVQDLLTAREDGRLHWTEALPMVLDASRGLVFAEKRGIIHRDIKPDNLMLTSEQRVKIGDLGLAKRADEEATGDKSIFGTPHFIAPEQAQGKDVTHAADLYALGASFYRMVTGRTPFSGATVKEILRKQITEEPEPIATVVPDFPPDLATIISKLMAKKVEERYQSATKLVEDLEAFQLAHEMELAGAKKANKPLMFGLAGVAVVLIGVVAVLASRDPEIRDREIRVPAPPSEPTVIEKQKTAAEIQRGVEAAATTRGSASSRWRRNRSGWTSPRSTTRSRPTTRGRRTSRRRRPRARARSAPPSTRPSSRRRSSSAPPRTGGRTSSGSSSSSSATGTGPWRSVAPARSSRRSRRRSTCLSSPTRARSSRASRPAWSRRRRRTSRARSPRRSSSWTAGATGTA